MMHCMSICDQVTLTINQQSHSRSCCCCLWRGGPGHGIIRFTMSTQDFEHRIQGISTTIPDTMPAHRTGPARSRLQPWTSATGRTAGSTTPWKELTPPLTQQQGHQEEATGNDSMRLTEGLILVIIFLRLGVKGTLNTQTCPMSTSLKLKVPAASHL